MRLNSTSRSAEPTKSPITFDDFQGRVAPPHCNARSKQQTEAISVVVPRKSIFANLTFNDALRSVLLASFKLRNAKIEKNTTPPIGRLLCHNQPRCRRTVGRTNIQKHHLQLILLVNAPPKMGLEQVAKPKTLTTIARYIGRFSKGTMNRIMFNAP
jgi:hypothetical protein